MGYFEAFNVSAYTGEAMPHTGSIHVDDSEGSPYAAKNFSYDFDALEVFNGKHLEQLEHFRVPADPGPGPDPTVPIPAVGEILETLVPVPDPTAPGGVRQQPQPAFPGSLEDYYSLLAQGRVFSAMGNSDSHSARGEAGLPRTYVYVGEAAEKSVTALSEEAVVDGIFAHRTLVTNGPFVDIHVNDQPMGSRVLAPDGNIRVKLKVQAAPWVDVRKIVVKMGVPGMGKVPQILATIPVAPSEALVRYQGEMSFSSVPDRAFIVAEVSGENSMWPVYTPVEVPSVQINEAVASLAGPLGFTDKYGKYKPQRVRSVTPFAFTSAIWVDHQVRLALTAAKKSLPLEPASGPHKAVTIPDLTKLFGRYHGH
jgi:hypothetical protein